MSGVFIVEIFCSVTFAISLLILICEFCHYWDPEEYPVNREPIANQPPPPPPPPLLPQPQQIHPRRIVIWVPERIEVWAI